jgi:hypothetical protein
MPRLKRKIRFESSSDESDSERSTKYEEENKIPEFVNPVKEVKTLQDLLNIGESWNLYCETNEFNKRRQKKQRLYLIKEIKNKNKDYQKIGNIVPHLRELNNMVGMKNLKNSIVTQILFFIQNLQGDEMMHTVLMGTAGCGKSTVGRILGKIYKDIGILSKGTFTLAQRTDFVGKYLGHTASKTLKLLQSCLGGVMFLDEAYSLGCARQDDGDSFAKEATDTLNQFLSEHSNDFICIIAGYENSLQKSFFSRNQGLERRFPWRFKVDEYNGENLYEVFKYQIIQELWGFDLELEDLKKLFIENRNLFPQNGGDCKIMLDKCKMAHAKRIFGKSNKDDKFVLNWSDIKNGFDEFKKHKNSSKNKSSKPPIGMYI